MSPRDIAINQVHASMHDRPNLEPLERYREATEQWEVIPVIDAGEIIGAILRKGYILHVGVTRPPSGSLRRLIREVLVPTIRAHRRVVTTVMEDHREGIEFCERLGFRAVDTVGGILYMVCERARYA